MDQAKVQMGMWCLMSAPLIMSNDLRKMRPEFAEILLNRDAIKIDQDPLGVQATRILRQGYIEVYSKPVLPSYQDKYSVAIGFLNRWTSGTPIRVSFTLSALGLDHPSGYSAFDIFERKPLGNFSPKSTFSADVNPSGFLLVKFDSISYLGVGGRKVRYRR